MASTSFADKLLQWAARNPRPLPWKNTKDPYRIWLSEIILQQTRVEQGLPYYKKFVGRYPTVRDLANAPQDEVMHLWEGLGYYSRARNLHATAKHVANELGGEFPQTFDGLKKLKGVGDYTAAAIAGFAYNLPHAVLDGNVYRILARYTGNHTPIDQTEGKKHFTQLAQQLLHKKQPGKYNQAIMDFGAMQCVPKNPSCESCPLQSGCRAHAGGTVGQLPAKSKKIKRKTRYFNYLVITGTGGGTIVQKRTGSDIWQNLYQFPMVESEGGFLDVAQIGQSRLWRNLFGNNNETSFIKTVAVSKPYRQQLTHQTINAIFFELTEIDLAHGTFDKNLYKAAGPNDKIAFPGIINQYREEKKLLPH